MMSAASQWAWGAAAGSSWLVRPWQSDEGLPNNDVTSVVQTPDHALVIATLNGLVRFDGWKMREMRIDIPGKYARGINGMCMGTEGQLWVVCRSSLMEWKPGHPPTIHPLSGLHSNSRLTGLFQEKNGAVWLSFDKGALFRLQDGKLSTPGVAEGLKETFASAITQDARGAVWAAGPKVLARWKGNRFEKVADLPDMNISLARANEEGLWLGTHRDLLRYTEAGGVVKVGTLPKTVPGVRISSILEDHKGRIWVGTFGDGLHVWSSKSFVKVQLPTQDVWTLTEDHEGNLWAGTGGGGVCRVRRHVAQMFDSAEGPVSQTARSITIDARGDLWVALQTNELFVRRSNRWQHLNNLTDWPAKQPTCLAADSAGNVWIGTSDQGLVRWDGQAFQVVPLPPPAPKQKLIRAMMMSREGELWISRGNDLIHGNLGNWQALSAEPGGSYITTLCQDSHGRVWAGTNGGRLLLANTGKLENRTPAKLSDHGGIRTLLATPDGSIWIGTGGGGLARLLEDKCDVVTTAQGLHHDVISQLLQDSPDRLWANGDQGLFSVSVEELNAVMSGKQPRLTSIEYSRDENLPGLQANSGYSPNTATDQNGVLWFASRSGLVIVHPEFAEHNTAKPKVEIAQMSANGATVSLNGPTIQTAPGLKSLKIEISVMSFTAPEKVRLLYRLDGIDDEWQELDHQREVYYGQLSPGLYHFRVRACNNDGAWTEEPTVLAFTVAPFFWQTVWFKSLSIIAALLGGLGIDHSISKWRLKRREERLRRKEALQNERTRIARDMHDHLGASLTQISMLADLAGADDDTPDSPLPQLAQTARQAVAELDEIVWAVNPRHDHLASLLEYMGQQCVDILHAAGIRCRLDFPEDVPAHPLPADYRHHLFLVVREAVNNAAKHAKATEVHMQVDLLPEGLSIIVQDDGCGLGPTKSLGNGLANMRSRAESLGGECQITSNGGEGTMVVMKVPWPNGHSISPSRTIG